MTQGKESACNAGDLGWILGWDDPLENGTPLLCAPCLEHFMDRRA